MSPDQFEALWASQPNPIVTATDLTRAIRPELNRRSRMIGYLMFMNGLGLILFPLLAVANYRYDPARYGTPWHFAQDALQLVVIVFWLVYSFRRLREHRALRRRQADTLRAANEVALANLEAEMKDCTAWRQPIMGFTLLSLVSAIALGAMNHGWTKFGVPAVFMTTGLLGLVGSVGWRHYRVNLLPAYARQKAILAQLS